MSLFSKKPRPKSIRRKSKAKSPRPASKGTARFVVIVGDRVRFKTDRMGAALMFADGIEGARILDGSRDVTPSKIRPEFQHILDNGRSISLPIDCDACIVRDHLKHIKGHLESIASCDASGNLKLQEPWVKNLFEHNELSEFDSSTSVTVDIGFDRFRILPLPGPDEGRIYFVFSVYERLKQLADELAATTAAIRAKWPDWFIGDRPRTPEEFRADWKARQAKKKAERKAEKAKRATKDGAP